MRTLLLTLTLCLAIGSGLWADVNVSGQGVRSLKEIAGTDTLVTVILHQSRARDVNLRVIRADGPLLEFESEGGKRVIYNRDAVREVRVQRDRVNNPINMGALSLSSQDDSEILTTVRERAESIFISSTSPDVQELRMRAAAVAGAAGSNDATQYLLELADSNNIPLAVEATRLLYSVGEEPSADVLKDGLLGGNRQVRAKAALVAGRAGIDGLNDLILTLVKDPTTEVFSDTAVGMGLLGDHRGLVYIVRAINALNARKGDAAVQAMLQLGGDDVVREMRTKIQTTRGVEWFRAIEVLYQMGDAEAQELMRTKCFANPAYEHRAALYLARDDYWDANLYLRKYLDESDDMSPEALAFRGDAAMLLLGKGLVQAKTHLRELLTMTDRDIYVRGAIKNQAARASALANVQSYVCETIGREGDRESLGLVEPVIGNQHPEVALAACEAVLSLIDPEYRARTHRYVRY